MKMSAILQIKLWLNYKELVSMVSRLKEPTFTFACGYKNSFKENGVTQLLYTSSNVEGAGLDINTGIFTAGHPGSYTKRHIIQVQVVLSWNKEEGQL